MAELENFHSSIKVFRTILRGSQKMKVFVDFQQVNKFNNKHLCK